MSLLFFKKQVVKCSILWVILFITCSTHANDSIPADKFLNYCKNSEAYLLHSYTDVTYSVSWGSFKRQILVSKKLVVNNALGVDKFAFFTLNEYTSNHLKEMEVKTLKANGTIIELDSSLVFHQKSNDNKFGAINYPIPGVEPGDTIVTSYAYTEYLKEHELMDFVSLYANVPCLNSEYTVKTKPDLIVRYKEYNNFPDPQVVANDTLTYVVFKMEKVKEQLETENTCFPCELPYLYYSLEEKSSKRRTWKDVYNQEFNMITQPLAFDYDKASYFNRWKRRVLEEAKDSSKYYQFELLHQDVINNMQMEPARVNEIIKSSGYFLKEKRFNPLSILRLYRRMLEDLEIEYWAVFARSKRSGQIDPHYIRMGEYDHIFFAYVDDSGSMKLLYPNEAFYKYQINEIPTALYNTQAVIVQPFLQEKRKKKDKFIGFDFELAETDSVTVSRILLPELGSQNYIKQVYYGEVDLTEKNTEFSYRFSVSGGLSTDLRTFFNMLEQNKEANDMYNAFAEFEGNESELQIDTITSTKLINTKPFVYTVNAKGTMRDAITFLNDSLVSISLATFVQHSEVESEGETTDLNYYLDYSYADYSLMLLNFPSDIEMLGIDNNHIDFKNDYGTYFFDVQILGNKQLRLQSNYTISKDLIPKEEYQQLKKINELVKEMKNKRLIVKLKKTT
jgi:hypothetical protein